MRNGKTNKRSAMEPHLSIDILQASYKDESVSPPDEDNWPTVDSQDYDCFIRTPAGQPHRTRLKFAI